MKLISSLCTRCGKFYDFDLYSGLCPHCGCFHRTPGVAASPKTIVKPEEGTLEDMFQKHLQEDKRKGIEHDMHKTTSAPNKNNQNTKSNQSTQKEQLDSTKGLRILIGIIVAITAISILLSS